MDANLATLLVVCPDRKGIVAFLPQVLFGHGANILDSDQHSDPVAGMFFQRIRFDAATLTTDRLTLETKLRDVGEKFSMTWRISYGSRIRRVAVLVSRHDHCLYDLLIRHRAGELPCEI